MISFLLFSTTLSVVKPLPAPNWPDQPVLTVKGPQTLPTELASLAGAPLTWKVQGVVAAVWVSMPKVQVQVPLAQTRFMFVMVHCWVAAIMETSAAAGAARAVVALRRAARRVVVNCILMVVVVDKDLGCY